MEHYDDGMEHSIWLGLVRDRLEIISRLMSGDGTLFIHIDDNELGYLIAIADEVMNRRNRVGIITFKQGAATGHKAINPGMVSTTSFILVYAKDKARWKPNRLFTGRERDKRYNGFLLNPDDDYSKWRLTSLLTAFCTAQGKKLGALKKEFGPQLVEEKLNDFVITHARQVVRSARPDYDAVSDAAQKLIDQSLAERGKMFLLRRDGLSDMYFKDGERWIFYREKLKEIDGVLVAGEPLTTLWDDVLSNNLHNEGGVELPKGKKPEALIKRCLELATGHGDLVLDSFAGSGTTGAVAHKMGRRWIMVELGEHCHTHIIPRLKKVIDGDDPGGITEAVDWKGGGGFRYYRLAPSLLGKGPLGQLGYQPQLQRRDAGRGGVQADGLHLCPERTALLDARALVRAGLHLRHDAEPDARPASRHCRGGRRGAQPADLLQGIPRKDGRLREPDCEENPSGRAAQMRMGQRRLQPDCREPSSAAAEPESMPKEASSEGGAQ